MANPVVFFDINAGGQYIGRIEITVYIETINI